MSMIYDDQPQMAELVAQRLVALYGFVPNPSGVCIGKVLEDAFVAIDRERLIRRAAHALVGPPVGQYKVGPEVAESVLVAAGVIPERS